MALVMELREQSLKREVGQLPGQLFGQRSIGESFRLAKFIRISVEMGDPPLPAHPFLANVLLANLALRHPGKAKDYMSERDLGALTESFEEALVLLSPEVRERTRAQFAAYEKRVREAID